MAANEAMRKRKVRVLTKAGFVWRYGNWVHVRNEVPFAGAVVSAMSDCREALKEDGWSAADIAAALPEREAISEEGRAEYEARVRRAG